jgi:hypothetical protein
MGMKDALFAIFVFSACATTRANTTASGPQQAQADEVVCQEVQRPGSMLTHQECRARADMDQERERMRDMMLAPRSTKSCMGHSDHGGGCR